MGRTAGTVEVFVPKEIIDRRIQHIFAGPNKGRKADHYLVVWEDYPLETDYTWEPETDRKTVRKMTPQKVQDVAVDQFRKNDKFTKKTKGTDNTSRQTLHQEVEQDEEEAASDGDDNGCDDEVSTVSEGVSEVIRDKEQNVVRRAARALRACCPRFNLVGSPGEVDRAD
jgi:hypothetical protein